MRQWLVAQYYELRPIHKLLPLIVSRQSAGQIAGHRLKVNVGVDKDHINICKLNNRSEHPYDSVLKFISECIEPKEAAQQFISVPAATGQATNRNGDAYFLRAYLDAGDLLPQIKLALNLGQESAERRCVCIVAPSGYGKTTLAKHISLQHGGIWLDPSLSPCQINPRGAALLVIDNVGDWKKLDEPRKSEIIRLIHSAQRTIVCSTSPDTGVELSAILGRQCTTFSIPTFTMDTAAVFLTKYCNRPLVLASFRNSDIENLCRLSQGIPGILVIAFDLMNNNPEQLGQILRMSRQGDAEAFAGEVMKHWLPKLLGANPDLGRSALTLLASDVNIFGLSRRIIASLLDANEDQVRETLAPTVALGYLQEVSPGYDETLIAHPIIRSALQAGALPVPDQETVARWRRKLSSLTNLHESACLSSLTANVWATREAFVKILSAKKGIPSTDLKAFYSKSAELAQYLEQQFIDVSRVQVALESAVGQQAISDCTIAVSIARQIGQLPEPKKEIGESIWALTQHPDGMAKCDAVIAASYHWCGYPKGQRARCKEMLSEFITTSVTENGTGTVGFLIGSALSGMAVIDEPDAACSTFNGIRWFHRDDRAVALSILALALAATNSPNSQTIWHELLRSPSGDECNAAARLYFSRSTALNELRLRIDPNGDLARGIKTPIVGSRFRLHACGLYSRNQNYRDFVDAAIKQGWITAS